METKYLVSQIQEIISNPSLEEVLDFDKKLDKFFGLDIMKTEQSIHSFDEDAYIGLDSRALLTSYIDYFKLLSSIEPDQRIVDLGAGYCRGTLLAEYLGVNNCVSLEFVPERVKAARKALMKVDGNLNFIKQKNLLIDPIDEELNYFLYFPKGEVLYRILRSLFTFAKSSERYLYVCESHGDVIEYLEMFTSISRESSFIASQPRHNKEIVKYKIKATIKGNIHSALAEYLLFHQFDDEFLVIDFFHQMLNEKVHWYVPIRKVEIIKYNNKHCLYYNDKRIIKISEDEKILKSVRSSELNELMMKLEGFSKLFIHNKSWFCEKLNGELVKLDINPMLY